jgi:hypothetical protein
MPHRIGVGWIILGVVTSGMADGLSVPPSFTVICPLAGRTGQTCMIGTAKTALR